MHDVKILTQSEAIRARPPPLVVAAPMASFWVRTVTYLLHKYYERHERRQALEHVGRGEGRRGRGGGGTAPFIYLNNNNNNMHFIALNNRFLSAALNNNCMKTKKHQLKVG